MKIFWARRHAFLVLADCKKICRRDSFSTHRKHLKLLPTQEWSRTDIIPPHSCLNGNPPDKDPLTRIQSLRSPPPESTGLHRSPENSTGFRRTPPDLQRIQRISSGFNGSPPESGELHWSPENSTGFPENSTGFPEDSARLRRTPADSGELRRTPLASARPRSTPLDSARLHSCGARCHA